MSIRIAWNKNRKNGKFITCKCGKIFYIRPSWTNKNIIHCSRKCKAKYTSSWNKGLTKETDERVKKYSDKQKGRKSTRYWLGKIRQDMLGNNHWNWKGGISGENTKLKNTLKYKEWRMSVYRKNYFTCQECGYKGDDIVAHHIRSWAKYPELRFDINNGITFCRSCHANKEMEIRLAEKIKR